MCFLVFVGQKAKLLTTSALESHGKQNEMKTGQVGLLEPSLLPNQMVRGADLLTSYQE
jgi:hypothetical protein